METVCKIAAAVAAAPPPPPPSSSIDHTLSIPNDARMPQPLLLVNSVGTPHITVYYTWNKHPALKGDNNTQKSSSVTMLNIFKM